MSMIIDERIVELERIADNIRLNLLEMALISGANGAHLGGSLSSAEVLSVLFKGGFLNLEGLSPGDSSRDRFILSKGHCAMAYYAALCEIGYLEKEDLLTFNTDGSHLVTHSVMDESKGIELSSGSLGLGISFAVGVALAGKKKNLDYRVFTLLGNGECNEGIVWEAFMSAGHFQLDNLIAIIDSNKMQLDGLSSSILSFENYEYIAKQMGWNAARIDGHCIKSLVDALNQANESTKPFLIVADTTKGKGVSFLEGTHHVRFNQDDYNLACDEIRRTR